MLLAREAVPMEGGSSHPLGGFLKLGGHTNDGMFTAPISSLKRNKWDYLEHLTLSNQVFLCSVPTYHEYEARMDNLVNEGCSCHP